METKKNIVLELPEVDGRFETFKGYLDALNPVSLTVNKTTTQ